MATAAHGFEQAPRLCILTQYFPPEMGAPQGRLSELGEALVDLGWTVEALTAMPNYPAGRVFPGYSARRPTVEQVGRIRTIRVPLYASQHGFVRRIACYLSFVASSTLFGARLATRPNLLWVESPPVFIGAAARFLAWHWRCPYVFNVSDLWPESAVAMGIVGDGLLARVAERFELSVYRAAAGVTGQSDEIVASVRRRVPFEAVELITNGVDLQRFEVRPQDRSSVDALVTGLPRPIFVYAGLLGLAQGLDRILELAASLPDDVPGTILLVGDGPLRSSLERRVTTEGIARIRIAPPIPRGSVPALLAECDVALVPLGLRLNGAVPSKLYEAMAARLPVLLVADGEPARRVSEAACGLVCSIGDLDALRRNFERLAKDAELRRTLGDSGRRAAEATYDRRRIAERLDAFLRSCLPAANGHTSE